MVWIDAQAISLQPLKSEMLWTMSFAQPQIAKLSETTNDGNNHINSAYSTRNLAWKKRQQPSFPCCETTKWKGWNLLTSMPPWLWPKGSARIFHLLFSHLRRIENYVRVNPTNFPKNAAQNNLYSHSGLKIWWIFLDCVRFWIPHLLKLFFPKGILGQRKSLSVSHIFQCFPKQLLQLPPQSPITLCWPVLPSFMPPRQDARTLIDGPWTLGDTLPETIRAAVLLLLRCLTGQLKAWMQHDATSWCPRSMTGLKRHGFKPRFESRSDATMMRYPIKWWKPH